MILVLSTFLMTCPCYGNRTKSLLGGKGTRRKNLTWMLGCRVCSSVGMSRSRQLRIYMAVFGVVLCVVVLVNRVPILEHVPYAL